MQATQLINRFQYNDDYAIENESNKQQHNKTKTHMYSWKKLWAQLSSVSTYILFQRNLISQIDVNCGKM